MSELTANSFLLNSWACVSCVFISVPKLPIENCFFARAALRCLGADTSDERLPLAPALRNLDGEPTVAWRSPALPLLRGEGLIDVLEATGSALKLRPTLLMSSGTWNSIVLM